MDKPVAIERFTEELLTDPKPPPHWGQELQAGEVQPVAGTSSGSTANTPKKALNRLEVWEGECLDQLKSMFPDVCPEHLLTCVQGVTSAAKERVGEEKQGPTSTANQVADERGAFPEVVQLKGRGWY